MSGSAVALCGADELSRGLSEMALPSAPRATTRRAAPKVVMGTALSTAMAASLVVAVIRTDPDQRLLGDVISPTVCSLQGEHTSRTPDRATSTR